MDQLMRGHRRFPMLVIAAIAGLMPAIAGASPGAANKLQVLVNDTAVQLQLSYRQHPDERAKRQEQLAAAIAAWRAAPRSEANNERLAIWLRAAIVSSMPGSKEQLPAIPSFGTIVKAEPQPLTHETPAEPGLAEPAIEKSAPVETTAKPEDDPFRDDPVSADE